MKVKDKKTIHTVTVEDDCGRCHLVRIREWDDGSGVVEANTREGGKDVWFEAITLRTRIHHYKKLLERINCVRNHYGVCSLR